MLQKTSSGLAPGERSADREERGGCGARKAPVVQRQEGARLTVERLFQRNTRYEWNGRATTSDSARRRRYAVLDRRVQDQGIQMTVWGDVSNKRNRCTQKWTASLPESTSVYVGAVFSEYSSTKN